MDPYTQPVRWFLIDLSVKIGGVTFKNPIFTASGTFGYGVETPELVDVSQLGAIVTKSITLHPREGNPPPRIVETSSGMINSIGLANIGVKRYIEKMLPLYDSLGTKIIVNIAGTTMDEYTEILERVEAESSEIAGYEINISCPNVKQGGMEFGVDCEMTARLTESLRKRTEKLLIMKLSPNVTDIAAVAQSAEGAGADALSAINTVVGMSIDAQTRKSDIYTTFGGLSGPAIKPIGLAAVHKIYQKVNIPIIGIGGIVNATDVVEYVLAGAMAVQVGTANFRDPGAGVQILNGLLDYVVKNQLNNLQEIVGKVVTYS